jgi:galactonate dehydratase
MRRPLPAAPAFAMQASGPHPLAMTALRAWRVKEPTSGRRYTVQSQSGAVGYGEGAPALASQIAEARGAVMGRRAHESEFVRARLNALPALEAAVSNAMLDLLCRAKNVPIYQFLGGPTRFKTRLLAQVEGEASIERAKRNGFEAFTMPVPRRDAMIRLQDYVNQVREAVGRIRKLGGEWVLDGGGALTPGDAATLASALEKDHLIWFDEPTNVLTSDALAKIGDKSVMPVGLGRQIHDIATFQNLLAWGAVNVLRPSLGLNSVAKIKRMAAVAESHYVSVAPYHGGGPIGTLAGIHLAAALPNSFIQEVPIPAADRDAAMRAELVSGYRESADKGFAALLNKPGLGVEVNERALDQYSEERV